MMGEFQRAEFLMFLPIKYSHVVVASLLLQRTYFAALATQLSTVSLDPVNFVLRTEQLPLTLVTTPSHAFFLSVNPGALKPNSAQEMNLSCENAHDSFLKHMQIVNTYIL